MDFSKIDMKEFGRHLFAKILKATSEEENFSEIMQAMVKKESMPSMFKKDSKAFIEKKDSPFMDTSFPPNENSLISDWDDDNVQDKVRLWRQFEWKRASTIDDLNDNEGKLNIFADDVTPNDIK